MPEDTKKTFPKDFLWGASTSAHQVEGGNHNDWTVWERAYAAELAKSAASRLSHIPLWPEIKTRAQDPDNYISGRGVEHYKRFEEDFDIAKNLNFNAFRFGIEWSRIEPEEGQWDQEALDHYRRYIEQLKKRGLEPVVNLWHYSLPVWFAKKGGFKHRKNLRYFDRYVGLIAKEYGHLLTHVITINEPNVYATFGYLTRERLTVQWPPQEKNAVSFGRVYWNLTQAHRRAYKILKAAHPKLQVGIADQLANIQAKRPHNQLDELTTKSMRYFWNWWFLQRIRKEQDFVGFNYYFTDYYTKLGQLQNPKLPLNDLGWYMEPEGLYPLLLRVWARYKRPIIVAENGVADAHDQYRRWWIEETIVAMERAISEGVDVRGYFHWSLLDNFEWAYGWWPKFGLVAVDRENGMKRTVRASAKWFGEKIGKIS
ncbi:glycoside hydrolase family 1 protein [Candidatus Saccharibacteria bacterium]|nr:glycoside hydrolase family 1 protein [Candidatus Saccharibacteria bacterium]